MANLEAALRRVAAEAKAAADAERQRRWAADAARQRRGKPRRGTAPKAREEPSADPAQMSCTAPALPSMPTHNTGWDSGGHAPARVAGASQSLGACAVTAATNDTQQAAPMRQAILATLEPAAMEPRRHEAGAGPASPATWESGADSDAAPQTLAA